jgi:hypothetical protein
VRTLWRIAITSSWPTSSPTPSRSEPRDHEPPRLPLEFQDRRRIDSRTRIPTTPSSDRASMARSHRLGDPRRAHRLRDRRARRSGTGVSDSDPSRRRYRRRADVRAHRRSFHLSESSPNQLPRSLSPSDSASPRQQKFQSPHPKWGSGTCSRTTSSSAAAPGGAGRRTRPRDRRKRVRMPSDVDHATIRCRHRLGDLCRARSPGATRARAASAIRGGPGSLTLPPIRRALRSPAGTRDRAVQRGTVIRSCVARFVQRDATSGAYIYIPARGASRGAVQGGGGGGSSAGPEWPARRAGRGGSGSGGPGRWLRPARLSASRLAPRRGDARIPASLSAPTLPI